MDIVDDALCEEIIKIKLKSYLEKTIQQFESELKI